MSDQEYLWGRPVVRNSDVPGIGDSVEFVSLDILSLVVDDVRLVEGVDFQVSPWMRPYLVKAIKAGEKVTIKIK